MSTQGIQITELPQLEKPLMIAGFDGWGNALKISSGMATYLIRKLNAKQFATIHPDTYFRYDEARPVVKIEDGQLKSLAPPGGSFYAVQRATGKNDIIILKADEPNLRWYQFIDELLSLCKNLGVGTILTLGRTEDLISRLKQQNVNSINYHGPSAIHSIIQSEAHREGFECVSLWCHCPFYLQGTTHFGILSHLGALLSSLGEFELDTADLEESWKGLNKQIQELINNNAEIQGIISELRKLKVRGSTTGMKEPLKDGKVINISDFLDPQ
jgi:proteasome assembly chaperone (PAC2) family protein